MTVPSRRRANPLGMRRVRRVRRVVVALAALFLTTSLTACVVRQEVAPTPTTGAASQNPTADPTASAANTGSKAQPGSPAQPGSKTQTSSKSQSGSTVTSQSSASSQQPTSAAPKSYSTRTLRIKGSYDLLDVNSFGPDVTKADFINDSKVVTAGAPTSFHWEDCVGGEVQGYLDLTATLNPATGDITVSGAARYYEGKTCGVTTARGSKQINVTIAPGGFKSHLVTLQDANGHVLIELNLFND